MYIPAAFAQADPEQLGAFIEQNSFGLLVSTAAGEPFASHIPFLLDRAAGPHGTLIGHLALANPHWRDLDGQSVLTVFSGPHAYISPTWYEADHVVPTWNYLAVHVYGTARVIRDEAELAEIVSDFVKFYEAGLPRPWQFDANDDYARKLLRAIVGVRIEISRMEGKWKLGQNRPVEQRVRAARMLAERPDENSQAIAALMASGGPSSGRRDAT